MLIVFLAAFCKWDKFNAGQNPAFAIGMNHCTLSRCYDKDFRKLHLSVERGEKSQIQRTLKNGDEEFVDACYSTFFDDASFFVKVAVA